MVLDNSLKPRHIRLPLSLEHPMHLKHTHSESPLSAILSLPLSLHLHSQHLEHMQYPLDPQSRSNSTHGEQPDAKVDQTLLNSTTPAKNTQSNDHSASVKEVLGEKESKNNHLPHHPHSPPNSKADGSLLKNNIATVDPSRASPKETETARNTRLNASLYHTSEESVNLYKNQNDSTDLLGRLYYDDYDSSTMSPSIISPMNSGYNTPARSPMLHAQGGSEVDLKVLGSDSNLGHSSANTLLLPSAHAAPLVSSGSSSSLNAMWTLHNNHSTPGSAPLRPDLVRMKLERGVSFDTVPHGTRKSLTLKSKHPQFKFRRNNKTWLVGYNNDVESTKAVEWLFDEMVVHGDTIIILQVIDEKKSPMMHIDKKQANDTLASFEKLNVHSKKIAIVFEMVIGKPQKLLKYAIEEYKPSMMIIGTHHFVENRDSSHNNNHHHHHHRGFFSSSSISKHFLECALVPVIIVKPTYKYVEYLEHPIDSENYFRDWAMNILHRPLSLSQQQQLVLQLQNPNSSPYKMKRPGFLSPSSSRSSSYTNLAAENDKHSDAGRGRSVDNSAFRKTNESRSRSTSKTRSFSRFFSRGDK